MYSSNSIVSDSFKLFYIFHLPRFFVALSWVASVLIVWVWLEIFVFVWDVNNSISASRSLIIFLFVSVFSSCSKTKVLIREFECLSSRNIPFIWKIFNFFLNIIWKLHQWNKTHHILLLFFLKFPEKSDFFFEENQYMNTH